MTRCFISLDLPEPVVEEIKKIQETLQKQNLFKGKLTEKEHLHLTLKFLGEIDEEAVEKVKERLKEIKIKKFDAAINKIGIFSPQHIRIIWLQLEGADELQKEIDDALQELFPKEHRFMGHITIARVRNIEDKKKLITFLENYDLENLKKQKIPVHEFFLKKSVLTPQGPSYSDLGVFLLG
ncbi:RNA 2',3'-cyclic phosphodiesterase [Candidatus Woesearchaeota archaeon]|nr:RNA 2',3'-cyclic phosphodiesterase [Candidatus Woesearchaeota archaeon]